MVGVPPASRTLWRRCSECPLPQISATQSGARKPTTKRKPELARWVLGGCVRQRCDGELVRVPIDDEFKSAVKRIRERKDREREEKKKASEDPKPIASNGSLPQ